MSNRLPFHPHLFYGTFNLKIWLVLQENKSKKHSGIAGIRTHDLFGDQYSKDLDAEWPRLYFEEELHYFAAKNLVGGLGPWVSAPPMGPTDLFENYIFEISMKNWINEPEHMLLVEFLS